MDGSATIFGQNTPGSLAQRIVEARKATGLTTAELAHRLGVRTATLASWEQGKAEPRTNRLMMLAGLLSVSPTWLLCGRGTAPHETGDADVDSLKASLSELRSMIAAMGEHVQNLEQRVESLNRGGWRTLVMRGEFAPAPTRVVAGGLVDLIPGVASATILGAGHMGPVTHSAAVNARILAHICQAAGARALEAA